MLTPYKVILDLLAVSVPHLDLELHSRIDIVPKKAVYPRPTVDIVRPARKSSIATRLH